MLMLSEPKSPPAGFGSEAASICRKLPWVPIDDTAAQLPPDFQRSQQSKPLPLQVFKLRCKRLLNSHSQLLHTTLQVLSVEIALHIGTVLHSGYIQAHIMTAV